MRFFRQVSRVAGTRFKKKDPHKWVREVSKKSEVLLLFSRKASLRNLYGSKGATYVQKRKMLSSPFSNQASVNLFSITVLLPDLFPHIGVGGKKTRGGALIRRKSGGGGVNPWAGWLARGRHTLNTQTNAASCTPSPQAFLLSHVSTVSLNTVVLL